MEMHGSGHGQCEIMGSGIGRADCRDDNYLIF